MRTHRRVSDELRFVSEFNILLDVTQQVAISQLRRLDERLAQAPPLVEVLAREYLPLLPRAARSSALVQGGAQGRLLLLLTSDEGMVGPLHASVVQRAMTYSDETTQWLVLGQRGLRLLGRQSRSVESMPVPSEDEVPEWCRRLGVGLRTRFVREQLQHVWLIAPHFVSPTRQDIVVHQVLPLPVPELPVPIEDDERVMEPSLDRVLEALAALWVEHVCLEAFYSARRAELAARALHVESSRHELAQHSQRLRHELFKSLHERVDLQVRETCVVQRQVASRMSRASCERTGRPAHSSLGVSVR